MVRPQKVGDKYEIKCKRCGETIESNSDVQCKINYDLHLMTCKNVTK